MSDLSSLVAPWQARLAASSSAKVWLKSRLPGELWQRAFSTFRLGLTPKSWPACTFLSDRVVIPLWAGGRVVGYRGRTYQPDSSRPKSVCWSTETADPLGVTPQTWPAMVNGRWVVATEGEMDALTLAALGWPALSYADVHSGETTLTRVAVEIDCWLLWADADPAGQGKAAKVRAELEAAGCNVRVTTGPGGLDANGTLLRYGEARVNDVVRAGVEGCLTVRLT